MPHIPRNNTNFTSALFEFYRSLAWGPEWNFLKYYQNTIRAYCDFVDADNNGLLAYLGMGMGKSILATSIAVDMLDGCRNTGFDAPNLGRGRRVEKCVFILTKSLAANMRGAFIKYFALKKAAGLEVPSDPEKWVDDRVTFVSMNASNMVTQFIRAIAGKGLSKEKLSAEDSIPGKILLKNTLVIVDEAHNLFRGITNGSKNGMGFYRSVEASLRQKNHGNFLLFLTGTPINNNAMETVPCFNLLGGAGTLPEDYEDFREAFVADVGKRVMKNESHFIDRILGLVAYATHETTPGKAIRGDEDVSTGIEFPEDLGVSVILCPMAPDQYAYYMIAREHESAEGLEGSRKGPKATGRLQLPKSGASSSYRTKSRQLSNFYEGNLENRDVAAIVNPWTPKFDALLGKVISHNTDRGTLGLVYSQYVGIGGLGSLGEFLKTKGWKEYSLEYTAAESDDTATPPDETAPEDAIDDIIPVTEKDTEKMAVDNLRAIEGSNERTRDGGFYGGVPELGKDIFPDVPSLGANRAIVDHLIHLSEVDGGMGVTKKKIPSAQMDPYAYVPVGSRARKNKIRRGGGDDWDEFFEEFTEDYLSGDDADEWDSFREGGSKFHNEDDKSAPIRAAKTFAIIKGGLTQESRARIEAVMTSPDNRHGEVISLVLVSSVGAEGLDFKAIRHVHILEPYWNWARLSQIQYRGIRNDSHKSLPIDEKNVKTYVYCAVPPRPETDPLPVAVPIDDVITAHVKDVTSMSLPELVNPGHRSDGAAMITLPDTTDVSLLYDAIVNYQVILSFLGPIHRASITAAIDGLPGARLCMPTSKPLYSDKISADLKMPDECRPYVVRKIMPKMVTVAGKEYMYVVSEGDRWGFRIFVSNGSARPVEVLPKAPEFATILNEIEIIEGIALDL